jgi:2-haloacid dehalogenase
MPGKNVDVVVFDVGNVLIDWDPRFLYRKLFDGDEARMEWFLANVCTAAWNEQMDAGKLFAEAVAELKRTWPEHAALIDAFDTRWPEMLAAPNHETLDIVRELRRSGHPTYALTNFSAEKFALTRKLHRIFDDFDGIVVSGEERCIKPDPKIYRILVSRYRLSPGRTAYVDDRAVNVDAARAEGFIGLLFRDAATLRRDLRALGIVLPDGAGVERS